jgi:3-oxoacyl-[acyl-carrier-protein] synthase III
MSNEYKEAHDERLADSVYEILDSLSDEAKHRMLEEMLIEAGLEDESFAWTLMHQKNVVIKDAEYKLNMTRVKVKDYQR